MELLVGPPYDLVRLEDEDRFRSRHECNYIRLLYCRHPEEEPYLAAARLLGDWQSQGLLVRDPTPAIYLYQIDFQTDALSPVMTRTGFIALLRLQDYKLGMIRPHERTFSTIKSDRLEWLNHCQASLSQILTFYDDPRQEVVDTLSNAAAPEPDLDFVDQDGIRHRVWVVTDPQALDQVAWLMETKQIYIADGHHRYETCLAHRDLMRTGFPQAHPLAAFNYTLIYAAAMQDPGLAILPAHRLMPGLDAIDFEGFLKKVDQYFEVRDTGLSAAKPDDRLRFRQQLADLAGKRKAMGFLTPDSPSLKIFLLKQEILQGLQVHPALKDLDVVTLREVLLRRCLELSPEAMDNDKLFAFDFSLDSALDRVLAAESPLGLLLNPTQVSQVKAVADAGLFMPRKSTIFYPKVSPGLVICPLSPEELVADPLYR
jgi:uncharacterized protein (DUF1015 family)